MNTRQVNTRTEKREQEWHQAIANLLVQEMTSLARIARICPPAVAAYLVTAIESLDAAILKISADVQPADDNGCGRIKKG